MNEQLRFSWGHIISFVAIIYMCSIFFIGTAYKDSGSQLDFQPLVIKMVIAGIGLLTFSLSAQAIKATQRNFEKRMRWEVFFVVFTLVFLVFYVLPPCYHFWGVRAHEEEIKTDFNDAVSESKKMFDNYEKYCADRIDKYEKSLKISWRGISEREGKIRRDALEYQLKPTGYGEMKSTAEYWMVTSEANPSVYNVFMLGNAQEIKEAIKGWNESLSKFSQHIMQCEYSSTPKYSNSISNNVSSKLDNVKRLCENSEVTYGLSTLYSFLLFLALMLPYIIQERHTKSPYGFILVKKKGLNVKSAFVDLDKGRVKEKDNDKTEEGKEAKDTSDDGVDERFRPFTMND